MKGKWVLKCVYTHLHALWAQLDSTSVHVLCVLGAAHLCVYLAQCSLLCRPSGPIAPLPPYQPVSSLSFLLLGLLFHSLSSSLSLWADGWFPGDDKVTVVATSQSLTRNLKGVLFSQMYPWLNKTSEEFSPGHWRRLFHLYFTLVTLVS